MYTAAVHGDTFYIAISSNSPTNVIEDLKKNTESEEDPPMPFLNSTVEEVYEFFKNHLRPRDDDPRGYHHTFSYFTFLAIDEDCIKSEPYECILCCDAPDYGDPHPETRLKQLRLPVARAIEGLNFLEDFIKTPSEVAGDPDFVMSMRPPSWFIYVFDDQGECLGGEIASPGRARLKRGRSVWKYEQGLP